MAPVPRKIFISYSHDSTQHKDLVLSFAQRLRADGIDAQIDQFVDGRPEESWPRWMLNKLDWADFVLLICTEAYYRRFRGHEQPGIGKGVDWEGQLITFEIYNAKSRTAKFVPVVFHPEDIRFIPEPVSDQAYVLDSEEHYQKLYRLLTGHFGVPPLELGIPKELPTSKREPLQFDAAGAKKPINLPFASLGTLFKGRETVIADIRQRFLPPSGRATGAAAHQVIHGLGGVGKTRLAIEFAWRYEADYTALLLISAKSPVDLRTNLAGLCDSAVFDLPEQLQPKEAVRLAAVFDRLIRHPDWLLILDSADSPDAAAEVEKLIPKLRTGHVIITSRISVWSPAVETFELDVLEEQEAAAFLMQRTESRRERTPTDSQESLELAREVDKLALALEQAGAYVAKNHLSFAEYRKRWDSRRTEVLGWYDEQLMKYPTSVAITWQTTLEQLSPPERNLLYVLSWFGSEAIPVAVFEDVWLEDASARDALANLASWSMVRWTNDFKRVSVHRLVQRVTRGRLLDDEKNAALSSALNFLDRALPSPEWDAEGWRQWETLTPHIRALLGHLRSSSAERIATPLMNQYGLLLYHRAQYLEAEQLFRRVIAIDEENLGRDDPNFANHLNNLAGVLSETNRLTEAESLYRRALAIDEKSFGFDHTNVANRLNNLAGLLSGTNRLTEAESLYRRALSIDEKCFGPNHPSVAIRLNNLAQSLMARNRPSEAEPLYRRALSITENSYGRDHPNVAIALNNLALLLQATDRLQEAEPLFLRALSIDEMSSGEEHPKVAIRLNNLALLLQATNRMAEAEPLFRRALAIDEKSFGPEHPNVATSLNNLARLLGATNRMAEAEPLFRRALAIDEKSSGPDHPNVATSLNNLAWLLGTTNRMTEAEPLYRRALAIDEKCFGPDHPNVGIRLNNLGWLLSAMNRMAEAEPLYRQALAVHENGLGPDHPNVATCLNNLAGLLRATNRIAEAEILYVRALAINEKSFGAEHPSVAMSLNNLAGVYRNTNRLVEAEPLYRRALANHEKSFGLEHPRVAISLNNLAGLLGATDRFAEAEQLYRRAVAIDEKSIGPSHPVLAIRLNNLAVLLAATNHLTEAELLYRRALAIDINSSGPDSSSVAICLNNLASLLCASNRLEEAEQLYRRALTIDEKYPELDHVRAAIILNNFALLVRDTNRLAEAEPLYQCALAIDEKSSSILNRRKAGRFDHYASLAAGIGPSEEEVVKL